MTAEVIAFTRSPAVAPPPASYDAPDCASRARSCDAQARFCDADPVFAVARQAYVDVVDMMNQCAVMSSRLRQIEYNMLYIGITRKQQLEAEGFK